nr:15407_t:CDS:1 [Entrophospora candida]
MALSSKKASDSTNQEIDTEELSPEGSMEHQHQLSADDDNNNTEAQENVTCQQPDSEPSEMCNNVNAEFILQGAAASSIVSSPSQDNIDDDIRYYYYHGVDDKQFNFGF